jgi:diguanylate cyclase (GGDEF)-like protein/PAS domain S-box-containing protein
MMTTPLRLLLVEDSEDDALLLIRHLKQAGYDLTFERVESAESCMNALERGTWDLILADYNLPRFCGLDALQMCKKMGVDAPFIIVSGAIGEDIAVDAMKAGAHDYVMKDNLKRLLPAIERELRDAEVRRARQRAEAELQANEVRYRELAKYTDDGVLVFEVNNDGEDFIVREFNLAAEQIEGVKRENVIGQNVLDVLVGVKPCGLFAVFQRVWRTGTAEHFAVSHNQNGRITGWRDNFVYKLPSGEIVTIYQDVTARKLAEQTIQESEQRLTDIVGFLPDATMVVDARGVVIAWNHAMEELTGVAAAKMIDKGDYEYALPLYGVRRPILVDCVLDPETKLADDYQNVERSDDTLIAEAMIPSLNGRRTHIWIAARALRDAMGNVTGAIESIRDITERKRAEDALAVSEQKFRTLFESMQEGVALHEVIYDEHGQAINYRIRNVNPAYEKHTGISPDIARGKLATDLYGTDNPPYLDRWAVVADTGEPNEFETYFEPLQRQFRISAVSAARGTFATVFLDITESKRQEAAIREREERLRSIFRVAPVGIGLVRDRVIADVNERVCQMTGYTRKELLGQSARILYPTQEDFDYVGTEKYRQISERGAGTVETRWQHKDGSICHILLSSTPLDGSDRFKGVTFTALDVTERKQAEEAVKEAHNRLQATLNAIPDIIFEIDQAGRIYDYRTPQRELLYVPPEKFLGMTVSEVLPESAVGIVSQAIADAARDGWSQGAVYCLDLPAGQRWFELSIAAKGDHSVQDARFIALARDITERKQAEEKLRYAGTHDSLTALYNRTYFEEEVRRLERGRTYPVSVALVDVDGLKEVNDTLGHAAGDDLLRRVGQVLLAAFRTEDVVARIGGDEFAVLLPGVDEAMAEDAIQRVRIVLAAHNRSADGSALSLSFGVATGKKGCRLDSLLKQADDRMYADKLSKSIKGSNDTTRKKATDVPPQRRLRLTNVGTNIQMKDVDSNA